MGGEQPNPRNDRCLIPALVALLLLCSAGALFAEDPTEGQGDPVAGTEDPEAKKPLEPEKPAKGDAFQMDETVVTASKTERVNYDSPRALTIVTEEQIREHPTVSIVDTMDDRTGVWVEKRTMTASDPVIRGFSGRNLLALIDGNTLSTLWGEGGDAGDDMYAKIDPDSVRRVEVVRGPASVLYGSNALGGVLNFFTIVPPFDFVDKGFRLGAKTRLTYESVAQVYMARQDVSGTTPYFRGIAGVAWRDIHDVEGGRGVGIEVPTSGEELNGDAKLQFRLSKNQELTVTMQDVNLMNTHRYYRPYQDNAADRTGAAVFYDADLDSRAVSEVHIRGYYQYKKDQRWWNDKGWYGFALTETAAGDVQASSVIGEGQRLTYGVHYEADFGQDPDDEQFQYTDQNTGREWKDAPDSLWQDFGVFVQDEVDLLSWLSAIAGFRYDLFIFDAKPTPLYVPAGGLDPSLDDIYDTENAYTGGVGLVFHLNENFNVFTDYSRGFRMNPPNFGLRQVAYGILVPNRQLLPIEADNVEGGLKVRFPYLEGTVLGYYTFLNNFQTIVPGTFQGQDWYDWNQNGQRDSGEDVYVTLGGGDAYVTGVEMDFMLAMDILLGSWGRGWSVRGGFTWNYGQNVTDDQPLRHTQPIRGIAGLRWVDPNPNHWGLWMELTGDFVGDYSRVPEDRIENDPGYRVDPQDMKSALLYPLPGYQVFDIRGGFDLTKYAQVVLAVENLTDAAYRPAHSRWDAPGINFIAQVTATF